MKKIEIPVGLIPTSTASQTSSGEEELKVTPSHKQVSERDRDG